MKEKFYCKTHILIQLEVEKFVFEDSNDVSYFIQPCPICIEVGCNKVHAQMESLKDKLEDILISANDLVGRE